MDEIDQYEAFAALKKQGQTIADIAARFGVTELLVKRRLAIAGLIPPVLAAYRRGDIEPDTLRQLTMATKAQQKAWFRLFRDEDEYAPTGHRLKAWLFGGAEIPVTSALFPVEQYGGNIVADLFDDTAYFDDAEKFWKLQMQAVIEKQAAYLEAGWADVIIMEIGRHFSQYDKVKRGRKEGGKVYISCARSGEIDFHEGWLEEKEARRLDKAIAAAKAAGKDEGKTESPAKPELTKAAIRYLDLHRQNAVRVELLKSPQIALRLIAASVISKDGLWDVRAEKQGASGNEAIVGSIASSKATEAFDTERQAVRELLGIKGTPPLCMLFARLLTMSDSEVLRILTFLMAESLPAGSAEVESLGNILNVDMDKWWTPDDAFFDLLRDKQAINAMLAEVAGKDVANARVTGTAKSQKDVIKASLAGTQGRKKVANWKPRYMCFPMQPYTKRKGLPAIVQWNAVKKLFESKQ
jgi:ParB family chromosome partitioning protein